MTQRLRGGTDESTSRREKGAAKDSGAPGVTVDCVRCGRALPPTAFRANTRKRNGLNSWCNACQVARTRQWREENRDALNERRRAWWAEHSDEERTRRAELAATHLRDQRIRAGRQLSRMILSGNRSRTHSAAVSPDEPRRSAGGRVVLPASPAGASPMNVAQER
jgi:hypothetical protein